MLSVEVVTGVVGPMVPVLGTTGLGLPRESCLRANDDDAALSFHDVREEDGPFSGLPEQQRFHDVPSVDAFLFQKCVGPLRHLHAHESFCSISVVAFPFSECHGSCTCLPVVSLHPIREVGKPTPGQLAGHSSDGVDQRSVVAAREALQPGRAAGVNRRDH